MPTRNPWESSSATEKQYARELRAIAHEIGRIINRYAILDPDNFPLLRFALEKYGELLHPWAVLRARNMANLVAKQNGEAWRKLSESLGRGIKREILETRTGNIIRQIQAEQVTLITSLPRKAGERVQRLALENLSNSKRADEVAAEIKRSGEVTAARATMIARTEVSKATTLLTQARAQSVGSKGYIWRTSEDEDVRPSHKKMADTYVAWDAPPTLDGLIGHAGCLPNCRCWAEPILAEEEDM